MKTKTCLPRLAAFALCAGLIVGCDGFGTGNLPEAADITPAASLHEDLRSTASILTLPLSEFDEVCTRRRAGRLILTTTDGYQFIRATRDRSPGSIRADKSIDSYALGLERLSPRGALLHLYELSSGRPLVLQEDPVPARLIRRIALTHGARVAVAELDQVLMWPRGAARGASSADELVVVTHPGSTSGTRNPDRPTDTDQPVPDVFICPVPDLMGSIDLTAGS